MRGYKRRKRLPATVLAVLAVSAILAVVLYQSVFVVRHVTVVGNQDVPAEDIVRASGLPLGRFVGLVSEKSVAERLESDGRTVLEDMHVTLFGSVTLYVRERQNAMMTLCSGRIAVLDRDCIVTLLSETAPDDKLVFVSGLGVTSAVSGRVVAAPQDRLGALIELYAAAEREGALSYVSEINVENVFSLYAVSRTGIRVSLGNADNLDGKLRFMVSALVDLEARGETKGSLDVSSGKKADFAPAN